MAVLAAALPANADNYLIGVINGVSRWSTNDGYKIDGDFYIRITQRSNFKIKIGNDDYGCYNGHKDLIEITGTTDKGYVLPHGEKTEETYGMNASNTSPQQFIIEPGTYKISINADTKQITVKKVDIYIKGKLGSDDSYFQALQNGYLGLGLQAHSNNAEFQIQIDNVKYGPYTSNYVLTKDSNPETYGMKKGPNTNDKFILKCGVEYGISIADITSVEKPDIIVTRTGDYPHDVYIFGTINDNNNWNVSVSNPSAQHLMKGADGIYTAELEFYATGYFRVGVDDTQYGPASNTDDEPLTSTNTSLTSSVGKAYTLESGRYQLYVDLTNKKIRAVRLGNVRPKTLYFCNSYFDQATKKKIGMDKIDGGQKYSYILNYAEAGKEFTFNFSESQTWKGYNLYPKTELALSLTDEPEVIASGNITIDINKTGSEQKKVWKLSSTKAQFIKFTVDFTDTDNPTITIEPVTIENKYYLAGGFQNDWDKTRRQLFIPTTEDTNVLKATAFYHEGNTGNKGFKITTEEKADNGTWYSLGGDNRIANGTSYTISGKTESSNMLLNESAYLKEVTYTLTLDDKGKPTTLKASWEGNEEIKVADATNGMPVYPKGVYNDDGLKRYYQWPVLYLKSIPLNNEKITPEYQMNRINEDRYELEFTMRKTNSPNSSYDWSDHKMSVYGFVNASTKGEDFVKDISFCDGSDNTDNKFPNGKVTNDGMRMRAICEKINGKWELRFEQVGAAKDIPFISLVGATWKQRGVYNDTSKKFEPYTTPANKNTDNGWQESWIQYDNRGNVLLDRSNKVMYNTMWPPINPILFKTEFTLNGDKKDFTLKSSDLTLTKVGTKTGSEWKNDVLFSGLTSDKKKSINNDERNVYSNQLALNDGSTYTLYRVENVWINGEVKLWTGWGGTTNSNNALWNVFSNWGHYLGESDGDGVSNIKREIDANSTISLGNRNGNLEFKNPIFFKTVYLFHNDGDTNETIRSVFYTELAKGGAQIAALSDGDYKYGNYQASLSSLGTSYAEGNLKSVTISSYKTRTNGTTTNDDMIANIFSWPQAGSTSKKNKEFHTLFDTEFSMDNATEGGKYTESTTASTAKWVKDDTEYPKGDYFYRMTVKFEDVNGNEETVIVDSNPFTIIKEEMITLQAYQLVKIEDKVVDGVQKGTYYTYKGSIDDPSKPVFPVYQLTIENDDKYDGKNWNFVYDNGTEIPFDDDNVTFDPDGNMVGGYVDDTNYKFEYKTVDEMPDYKSNNYQFTDKILIVGSTPSANVVEGYNYRADNAKSDETQSTVKAKISSPAKADNQGEATEEWDRSTIQSEYGDRFMHVTNVGNFNQREFKLEMKYTDNVLKPDGSYETREDKTPVATVVYTPVIPEPTLKEALVEVLHSNEEGDGQDNLEATADFNFTSAGRTLKLEGARYHSVRDHIILDFPNVSRYMKERMRIRNFFTITMDGGGVANDDEIWNTPGGVEVWNNIFTFGDESGNMVNDTIGVVNGPVMHPSQFNRERKLELKKEEGYQYINRGWRDLTLTPIYLTDNAPINITPEISDVHFITNDDQTISVSFKVTVKHSDNYTPSDPDETYPSAEINHHNYIFHLGKNQEGDEEFTIEYDKTGNPIFDEMNQNQLMRDHLHHHTDKDYYYVAIVDKLQADQDATGDHSKYIVGKDGNVITKDTPDADLCHGVVKASQLLVELEEATGEGISFTIEHNFGKTGISPQDVDDYVKNLAVEVSYLYPFMTTKTETQTAKRRVISNYHDDVLKSQAKAVPLESSNVTTELDELFAEYGSVRTGEGFIEVDGDNVVICNVAGIVIARKAGRYNVAPGVYVVTYNGRTEKVVVK